MDAFIREYPELFKKIAFSRDETVFGRCRALCKKSYSLLKDCTREARKKFLVVDTQAGPSCTCIYKRNSRGQLWKARILLKKDSVELVNIYDKYEKFKFGKNFENNVLRKVKEVIGDKDEYKLTTYDSDGKMDSFILTMKGKKTITYYDKNGEMVGEVYKEDGRNVSRKYFKNGELVGINYY
jgi:hypothetical protein